MKFVFNFQLYFETSEIRPNFDLFSKFLKKIEISSDNIFHLRVSKYSKISIISKNMRDMKMNQKSKMWHLTCSTRLCSLKLHWITFNVPTLKYSWFSIWFCSKPRITITNCCRFCFTRNSIFTHFFSINREFWQE